MDFKDPLASYTPISRHPSPDTPPVLAPDSLEQRNGLRERVDQILDDYIQVQSNDDTANVFRAFLNNLCKEGEATLISEILQFAADPPKLRMLRNFLVDAILKPMAIAGGHKPESLTPTPVKSAQAAIQLSMTEIQPSSRNDQANLKKICFGRDNHRCVVTRFIDQKQKKTLPSHISRNEKGIKTECAHILPFALRKFNENSAKETESKATIWWAIYRYFPFIRGKIGAETINKPENAITLWIDAHSAFGEYSFALEPLDTPHMYRSSFLEPDTLLADHVPAIITMKQSDSSIPMPDPDFFKVHFQISTILQVSSIGKKIQDTLCKDDYNSTYNIHPDGSTNLEYILCCKMLMDI
ncbi:hypothetical protein V8C37DRAFT_413943 [Trichoderma ceciliae]